MDRVKVSIGKTYNLGNYESLRLDVGVELDVFKSNERMEEAYRAAKATVKIFLKDLEKNIKEK